MERFLSLVLDEDCKISLTLERIPAKQLDEYISKNFNSTEDIRNKYKDKIDKYLNEHQDFLDKVEKNTGRKYRGSIVITELQDNLTIKKYKVLYKKDLTIFKEITKNHKFITAIRKRDYIDYVKARDKGEKYYRIFLEYYGRELSFREQSPAMFDRVMGQWRNSIKDSWYYYEIIRRVLKEYQNRHKELKLDSLDVVYSKHIAKKQLDDKIEETEYLKSEAEFKEAVKKSIEHKHFDEDLSNHIDDYKDYNEAELMETDDDPIFPPNSEELETYKKYLRTLPSENKNGEELSKTKTLHTGSSYKIFSNE